MNKSILLIVFFITNYFANANEDNQSFDLWHDIDRHTQLTEEKLLAEGQLTLKKNAEQYPSVNLGMRLMSAINHRQWGSVEVLLAQYQQQSRYDKSLVLFANASLAGAGRDYEKAEKLYEKLLKNYPDFVRGQLDLARVQFDNHKNLSAKNNLLSLNNSQLPPMVGRNIEAYLNAIDLRQDWHGSFSFGFSRVNNLNESSNRSDCLLELPSGICVIERNAPESINAIGLNYEATLGRRFEIADHHGLIIRGLWYGRAYSKNSDYNESTTSVSVGYSYQDSNDTFVITPLAEYSLYGNKSLYRGFGLRSEWRRKITSRLNTSLQVEHKKRSYHHSNYQQNEGYISNIYTTLSYSTAPSTVFFTGFDWERGKAEHAVSSYKQHSLRLGVYQQFAGFDLALSTAWRNRQFEGYNAVLQAQRADRKRVFSIEIKRNKPLFAGFTPTLSLEHVRNDSNVDWLYSYNKNSVHLKLEKRF